MPNNPFGKLLKQGRLRKQKAGIVQIEALLKQAIADLAEAKKIAHIAERATYLLAYMAMLKAGRALLLFIRICPRRRCPAQNCCGSHRYFVGREIPEFNRAI